MFFERVVRGAFTRSASLPAPKIAIIGSGPSGLAMTIALMKRLYRPFDAWMIDASDAPGAFGDGLAGEALTFDVAGDLSVIPDRPDDFVDWLKGNMLQDGAVSAMRGPHTLHVRRSLFRDYVMARFAEALAVRTDVTIRTFRGEVSNVASRAGELQVTFADGESVSFDHVFLATGLGTSQRESDSWRAAEVALERLSQLETPPPLTLLGNGPRLAAILLHLRSTGYAGEIRIDAAGQRMPRPHPRGTDTSAFGEAPSGRSLLQAFRYVRQECMAAQQRPGGQWQRVIDAASARLTAVWRHLPQVDRNRYRRHLLRLHRNLSIRIAPDIHQRLQAELQRPRTQVVKGRNDALPLCPGAGRQRAPFVDCRDVPAASGLAGLLSLDVNTLSVDDCGRLLRDGERMRGISAIGVAASCLRPGPFTFAETVRQAYRGALDVYPHDVAHALRH
jgi:uncharacterized NAD(P)/FAD-binding protein YdhS